MWRLVTGCGVAALALTAAAPAQARCGPRTAAPLTWGVGSDSDFEAQPPVMAYRPPSAASGLRDAASIHVRGSALVACPRGTPLLLSRLRRGERLSGATQNGDRLGLRIAGPARDRLLVLHVGRRGVTSRRTLRIERTGDRERDPRILLSPDGGLAWIAGDKRAAVWPAKARAARLLAPADAEIRSIRPVDTGTMQIVLELGELSKPFAVAPPTPGRCHGPRGPTLAQLGDLRASPLTVTRYSADFSAERTLVLRVCDMRTGRTVAALRGTSSQAPNLHDSYTDQLTRLALAGGLALAERLRSTSSGTQCGLRDVEILRLRDGRRLATAIGVLAASGDAPVPITGPSHCQSQRTQNPVGAIVGPGLAAWHSFAFTPDEASVTAMDAHGIRTLDAQDRDTAPIADLGLDGSTLHWTVAGAPRQAQLTPGAATVLTTRSR